jgi:hypothetical protein
VLWSRRRKGSALNAGMRGGLFADESLEDVASRATSTSDDIWSHFAAAQQALREGDKIGAIQAIRRVEEMEGQEARLHLQAWHCLRMLGEPPPESIAREVKGVVVEVGLGGGVDLVAAYADHTARYWNFRAGTGIIWDAPEDTEMASLIDALLQAGEAIVENTGPLDGARPLCLGEGGLESMSLHWVACILERMNLTSWPSIRLVALPIMPLLR